MNHSRVQPLRAISAEHVDSMLENYEEPAANAEEATEEAESSMREYVLASKMLAEYLDYIKSQPDISEPIIHSQDHSSE